MKNKKRYFIKISNITKPANQLQAAMLDFIMQYANIITNDAGIIIEEICRKIEELNIKHSKTSPLVFRQWQIHDGDFGINFSAKSPSGLFFYRIKSER